MEMVFVYEDKIARDAVGNYYVGSAFSQKVFDRYLQHFDHITLLMRSADVVPDDTETLSRLNRIDTSKIDVVYLPTLTADVKKFFDPRLRAEFKRIVESNIRPDRAVILRAPSSSGTIAADYCLRHGIPYLAEAVGCPWDSLWNHSLKGKILAPHEYTAFRRTMRNASYAVYVTSEFLQRRYPTKGKMVAISDVELQQMDDSVIKKRLEKIQDHKGKIKLGTAAAVNAAYKGQQFVMEALAKLKMQGNTNFEYHLAGGGDPAALMSLSEKLGVRDQVVFEGSLQHDAIFAWFDDMDLYIQPSLQEGLPRAVVEAMSRGLPAFGARTGGIPELLGADCIFPRKGVDAIVDLLSQLSKEQMALMAENNFEHAKQFQKEILEKKRYEFYSAFAAEAKRRQG